MSLQEKVLMRKIKKREKQKLTLLQLKEAEKNQKDQQHNNTVEDENKSFQRLHEGDGVPSKKNEIRDDKSISLKELKREIDSLNNVNNGISEEPFLENEISKKEKKKKRKKNRADPQEPEECEQLTSISTDENSVDISCQEKKEKRKKKKSELEEIETCRQLTSESADANSMDVDCQEKKKKKKSIQKETEKCGQLTSDSVDVSCQEKKKKRKKKNSEPEETEKRGQLTNESAELDETEKCEQLTSDSVDVSCQEKKKKRKKKNSEPEETEKRGQLTNESADEKSVNVSHQDSLNSNVHQEIPSDRRFASLKDLSEKTAKAIEDMGLTTMTEIQARCLPHLLQGAHLVGAAKTGSGKTLSFLIPAVEFVYKIGYKPRNGTGALIISPTRELAMQIFGVLTELMKYHHNTYGLIMGGANKKREEQKLFNGINILVATPGRLLDHLQNTPDFVYKNITFLVLDEADIMLDIGFEKELNQIFRFLPDYKQTIMFSATQNQKTKALAERLFKNKQPIYVTPDDAETEATVSGLEQGYAIVPPEKRLLALFTALRNNRRKKVMVFFSSCLSVKFHHDMFNYIDLPVMCIHGQQKQTQRISTFFKFCNATSGTLLCTDIAARGLDIPAVDWIIQYDPPDDPREYIHRVGRTARGEGSTGRALLILTPEELNFRIHLKMAKIPLNEFEIVMPDDIQIKFEHLIRRNIHLNMLAKEAFKAYVKAYESHRVKNAFDATKLDFRRLAYSFGLTVPPFMDSNVAVKNNKTRGKSSQRYR